jgi:PAS domain S-box-containing protein
MDDLVILWVGLFLVIVGVTTWIVTRRSISQAFQNSAQEMIFISPDKETDIQAQAVFVIQTGGKLISINESARKLLNIHNNSIPNFRRISHLIRPTDEFIRFCNQGGTGRFFINGSAYDFSAASLPVSMSELPWTVITISCDLDDIPHNNGSPLTGISNKRSSDSELLATLDLPSVILSILDQVESEISSDFLQLLIWQSSDKDWVQYRNEVNDEGVKRAVKKSSHVTVYEGMITEVISSGEPILVSDTSGKMDDRLKQHAGNKILRSYIAVPIMFKEEVIAVIELGSVTKDAFQSGDLGVLSEIADRGSIPIKNAYQFSSERKRISELSILIDLSKAMVAVREPQVLFNHLVESIKPLFDVSIFGFLIYNENRRILQGQAPFIGLPEQFLQIYLLSVQEGGRVESLLVDQDIIISEDAANDPQMEMLGLQGLARAASLREMVLVPLVVGGRTLGYIQAGNHTGSPRAFSDEELQLLLAVSNQAAPIVENFLLIQQSRLRAQRSEALRRIGSLASSAVSLDETLKYSLQELMHLIKADFGCIFLVDETTRELALHAESVTTKFPRTGKKSAALSIDDPQFPLTIGGSHRSFTLERVFEEQNIIPFYRNMIKEWKAQSAMAVPLIVQDRGIGELWIVSHQYQPYDQADLQVMGTAAGLMAGVVERSILSSQTDEKLRLRLQQMSVLNRISHEMSVNLDTTELLQLIYDEALRLSQADCGVLFMFDESSGEKKPRIINQFSKDDQKKEISEYELDVLMKGKPELIPDLDIKKIKPPHKGIKGWIVLPINNGTTVVGLLSLHSHVSGKFDQDALDISQSLVAQASLYLQSVSLRGEQMKKEDQIQKDLEIISDFSKLPGEISPELPLDHSLQILGEGLIQKIPFKSVSISILEEAQDGLSMIWHTGNDGSGLNFPASWKEVEALIHQTEKIGCGYLVHLSKSGFNPIFSDDRVAIVLKKDDVMIIPVYSIQQEPLGLISLSEPYEEHNAGISNPHRLDLFSGQVRYVLESHRYHLGLQKNIAELQVLQANSKARLLDISSQLDTWKTNGENLNKEITLLHRHERFLEIGMKFINQLINDDEPQDLFQYLSEDLKENLGFEIGLIARQVGLDSELLDVIGDIPAGVNPGVLFGQRNPLRQTLQDGSFEIYPDITEDSKWKNSPLLIGLQAKGIISIPLSIPGYPSMAAMWVSHEPITDLTGEDYSFIRQISTQAQNAIQNQVLIRDTRRRLKEMDIMLDYTRKLGSPSQTEIVDALIQTAQMVIGNAQAIWVCLIDPLDKILKVEACFGMTDKESALKICFGGPSEEGQPASLVWQVCQTHQVIRMDEVDFAREYLLSADDLLAYRSACDGQLPLSCLVLPLLVGENCLGSVLLENRDISAAFTAEDETLAVSLSQQAALAIQNAQLFLETRRLTEDLEKRVEERTTDLRREHNNTQTLLRVITELSASLDLEQVMNRTLAVINESIGSDQSLIVVTSKPNLVFQSGKTLVKVGKTEQEIAKQVAKSRQPLFTEDTGSVNFISRNETGTIKYRSLIAVPLMMGEEVLGALMVVNQQISFFKPEQINVLQAIARQVSVSLNNAELFTLIRDQAENQGGLLRTQQIEASRSRAILEAVADGVMVTDAQNKVKMVNFSAERILSLKSDVLVGNPIERLESVFGLATKKWVEAIRQWTGSPTAPNPLESYIEAIELDNGRIIAVNLAPVYWRSTFLGTVSIFRDITTEVRFDRMKSEFVANVSHELRTPMTSIKGYVDIMLMGASGDLNEKQVHFLEIIRSNTQRLNVLVNDLLDVSRLESGSINLNFQEIDLRSIIQEVVKTCQRRAEEARKLMRFEIDVEADLPVIRADTERLRQILNALVTNGLNYSDPGGIVKVEASKKEGFIQVDVVDHGIGIPIEDHPRIFERFYRGSDPLVLETAGTGLGLVMAKTLVEMHHGRMWFTSEGIRGEGTVFSFSLPY